MFAGGFDGVTCSVTAVIVFIAWSGRRCGMPLNMYMSSAFEHISNLHRTRSHCCRLLNLPFIAVMPKSTSSEKIALIEFYGGRWVDWIGVDWL